MRLLIGYTSILFLMAVQLSAQPSLTLSMESGRVGTEVQVDIIGRNWNQGSSGFFSCTWDDSKLRYDGLASANSILGFDEDDISTTSNNRILISWESSDIEHGSTFTEEVLASFYFTIQENVSIGEIIPITFEDVESTSQELEFYSIINGAFQITELDFNNGSVTVEDVSDAGEMPTFVLSTDSDEVSLINLSLTGQNFRNASSFLASFTYDNTSLSFQGLADGLVVDDDISIDVVKPGRCIIQWQSDELGGLTTSSSLLKEFTFLIIDPLDCETYNFEFSNISVTVQNQEYWKEDNGNFLLSEAQYVNGIFTDASTDYLRELVELCPNTTEELILPENISGQWFYNGSPISQGNRILVSDNGSYAVQYQVENCLINEQVLVIIQNEVDINLPPSITVDRNAPITIDNLSSNLTYSWMVSDSLSISCSDCPNPTITALGNGLITLSIESQNTCISTLTIPVIVGELPSSPQLFVGIRNPSCFNTADGYAEAIVVGGVAPYTYQWSDGGNQPEKAKLANGSYSLLVTDAMGQSIQVDVLLQSQQAPLYNIIATDASCDLPSGMVELILEGNVSITSASLNNSVSDNLIWEDISPGTYTLLISDEFNCAISDTVQINNLISSDQLPQKDTVVEVGSELTFQIDGFLEESIRWQFSDNFSPSCLNCPNPTIVVTESGSVAVTAQDEFGCQSESTFLILTTDDANSQELQVFAPFLNPSCYNTSDGLIELLIVGGTPPYSISWEDVTSSDVKRTILTDGVYSATITDAQGSVATINRELRAQTFPNIQIETQDPICNLENGAIEIKNLDGIVDYRLNGESQSNLLSSDLAPDIYELVVIDEFGCVYDSSLILEDQGGINLDLGGDKSICNGTDFPIVLKPNVSVDQYNWYLDGILISSDSTLEIVESGSYVLRVEDRGCDASDSVEYALAINDYKLVDSIFRFPEDTEIPLSTTSGDSVIYSVESPYILSCSYCAETTFESNTSDTIEIDITSLEGCLNSQRIFIIIEKESPIKPINVMTPNGDGYNDYLDFEGLEAFDNVSFKIYNEWGKKLLSMDPYTTAWDGRINGSRLVDGVYYYILTYRDLEREYATKGDLLILNSIEP